MYVLDVLDIFIVNIQNIGNEFF